MALFAYRAVDAEGRISTGNLDASNAIDLELRLKRLGLDLLTFEGVKRSTAARTRNAKREDHITFFFHHTQLLKTGKNTIEGVTDLPQVETEKEEILTRDRPRARRRGGRPARHRI